MFFFIIKVLVSSLIISIASWLSLKKPTLAGFLIALPLMSIIAIFFSYNEHRNLEKTIIFSKSILVGIPISLSFFLPFFFAKSLGLGFYSTYSLPFSKSFSKVRHIIHPILSTRVSTCDFLVKLIIVYL